MKKTGNWARIKNKHRSELKGVSDRERKLDTRDSNVKLAQNIGNHGNLEKRRKSSHAPHGASISLPSLLNFSVPFTRARN